MRVFLATLGTETNTFASFPTGMEDFRRGLFIENGVRNAPPSPWSMPARTWAEQSTALGWDVRESIHAFAEPAGPTIRSVYESLRDRILHDLAAAAPVDLVLLFLHGAMVAEGYDDCEADLVSCIRQQVGPQTRIGVELDLHAHLDDRLLSVADAIVFYKAYPHIDYAERARDLFELMRRTVLGEIQPVMALHDCRTMGLFPTTREGPMPGFVADMIAAEGRDGILSLSLNHGFPWADVPHAGAKMLAIADGDRAAAKRAAERFGQRFCAIREQAMLDFVSMEDAIARAKQGGHQPILLADTADQTGGGAPGDTTHVLRALIEHGITDAAYAPLWDPLAVDICFQVGVGARLMMRLGGKLEPHSGLPLDAEAEVLFLQRDAHQDQLENERVSIGDVAVVRVAGIEILLNTQRVGVFSPTIFTHHGIELGNKKVIVVKNLYRHRDVFRPLTREQLFVASPGLCSPNWASIPFARLQRPIWPLDHAGLEPVRSTPS